MALEGFAPDWFVSTAAWADIYDRRIIVGHPSRIVADSFDDFRADLLITLYVSEAESVDSVGALYDLISPGSPSFLVANLQGLLLSGGVRVAAAAVANVGPRDEGPSGFVAADIEISLQPPM